ncbi:hypothetical protein R6138_04571 [Ralstonia thomasii]|uniref:hypothetical protein n=1 Tax=Ralstonia thomasii TaxID=3058596 RepID=UPI0028F66A7D|nr:hypothetical protein [Ralstonia sp. LMG 18095]CAJ0901367.1 hypothetical protein R6138_04571 [Ralstonia sp. LMG 18095]
MSENKFKVGDRVQLIDQTKYDAPDCTVAYWRGPMVVVSVGMYGPSARNEASGMVGAFSTNEIELCEPEKPAEYRIRTSFGKVLGKPYTSAETAAEEARQHFSTDSEFDVIEVRTVAKYKVVKTLQAV